jgi:hypothetical protein
MPIAKPRRSIRQVDAFLTLENGFDARYRAMGPSTCLSPAERIGAPQNPRRITVGFDVHFR